MTLGERIRNDETKIVNFIDHLFSESLNTATKLVNTVFPIFEKGLAVVNDPTFSAILLALVPAKYENEITDILMKYGSSINPTTNPAVMQSLQISCIAEITNVLRGVEEEILSVIARVAKVLLVLKF